MKLFTKDMSATSGLTDLIDYEKTEKNLEKTLFLIIRKLNKNLLHLIVKQI